MRTEAIVTETDHKTAIVKINRKSACDGCHKTTDGSGCSVCSLLGADSEFTSRAKNDVGARVGDRVIVETASSRVLFYAILVFLLPLLVTLACWGISTLFTESTLYQFLFALVGFIGTFVGVWIYSERVRKNKQDIIIVSVVQSSATDEKDTE